MPYKLSASSDISSASASCLPCLTGGSTWACYPGLRLCGPPSHPEGGLEAPCSRSRAKKKPQQAAQRLPAPTRPHQGPGLIAFGPISRPLSTPPWAQACTPVEWAHGAAGRGQQGLTNRKGQSVSNSNSNHHLDGASRCQAPF